MAFAPLRVACIGMGWWSDVLADAMIRSGRLDIIACFTRSPDKRAAFAAKYNCREAPSYEVFAISRFARERFGDVLPLLTPRRVFHVPNAAFAER